MVTNHVFNYSILMSGSTRRWFL